MSTHAITARIADRLTQTVGDGKYERWFESTHLEVQDQQLRVHVPSRFVADWIGNHFNRALRQAAQAELGGSADVELRVNPACGKQIPDVQPPQPTRPTPKSKSRGPRPAPRDPHRARFRLEDFVVGPSNELAYSAALRLEEELEQTRRSASCDSERQRSRTGGAGGVSPLFIHGGCGLGKTHLLQGLCRRFSDNTTGGKWRYTTAEQFTNRYVQAVRTNHLGQLREQLRRLDLLVIDDVHFLSNKSGTQTELLHTLDAIDLHGAKVVMASDAHPKQIREFSDALVSRFMCGMVVRINAPDQEMRVRLVDALARRRGIRLRASVASLIAHHCVQGAREIEGALTKLSALASLESGGRVDSAHQPIGHAVARRLFSDPGRDHDPRPLHFQQIHQSVCETLQVDPAAVLSRSRHKRVVLARSAIIHLARQCTTLSFPELARHLNRSNHSTIVTAAKRTQRQVSEQAPIHAVGLEQETMDQLMERLRRQVTG